MLADEPALCLLSGERKLPTSPGGKRWPSHWVLDQLLLLYIFFFNSSYGLLTCSDQPHPSSRWCRDLSVSGCHGLKCWRRWRSSPGRRSHHAWRPLVRRRVILDYVEGEKNQKASMSLGEKLYDVRATVGMWRWTIELLAFSKSSFLVSDVRVHHFNSLSSSNCLTQTTSKLWIFVLLISLTLFLHIAMMSIKFFLLVFNSVVLCWLSNL